MPQVITIYRNEHKVLCTDCRDSDFDDILICKKLFLDIENTKKWLTNPELTNKNISLQQQPIIIQSITFTI